MTKDGRLPEEIIHRGLGVSEGIAYGAAYLIPPDTLRVPHLMLPAEEIDAEVARFDAAVAETRRDIERVRDSLIETANDGESAILEPHLLILEDEELLGATRARIREEGTNAEFALHASVQATIRRLELSENAYFRERARDVRDVHHRVIRKLLGEREPAVGDLMQNAILIAHDLPVTLTAELDRDRILGVATEIGAGTSHSAILARALEIPAITDLGPVLRKLTHGEPVILDGREGLLIEHPTEETLAEYNRLKAKIERKRAQWVSLADRPGVTADGVPLTFLANIEFAREVSGALAFGCEGVGLYRTEYLFLQSGGEMSEDEQYDVYSMVVERMHGRPVTIRTLDVGGDKLLPGMGEEDNPFLGWRAIRYCLDRPEVFRAQLRAILRAGALGPVEIMLPMVTAIEEVEAALEHVAAAGEELRSAGVRQADRCPVGVLVETPGAALMSATLAERFDFLSIGTNDLIQYTLAVDRGNRRVSHLYQPFHPAVLNLVGQIVSAAETRGLPVTVCGEMSSHAPSAALLLGLGVTRFSMVPSRIPRVKQVLGRITRVEAADAASAALGAISAVEAIGAIEAALGDRFRHAPDPSQPDAGRP